MNSPSEHERDRAREIVEHLPADPALHGAYLDQACGGDHRVRRLVERFLQLSKELEQPFEARVRAVAKGSAGFEHPAAHPQPGERVGPYAVVRLIGVGGMGAAYLAERADGHFERQVVLKVGRRPQDPVIQRLLERERDVLASLQHPFIAPLLDGGVTAQGLPFLAIEYVKGVPITEYCDTQRLDVGARVSLFNDVLAAVEHAHRSLVVHQDLKPSNILVTEDGVVRLIDFGIAKVLLSEQEAPVKGAFTPAYAAPEQMRGDAITTASDVYALGVLLYELTTGCRPYVLDRRDRSAALDIVSNTQANPPSQQVLVDCADTASARAAARSTEPQALRKRIRGDLDDIVLKTLAKQPEDRYRSVEALRRDLSRWADTRPISLNAHRFTYRAQKLVRRHLAVWIAGLLGLLALVGGVATTLWQARQTATEAARAEQVTSFVLSLFESTDPDASGSSDVSAMELLSRSVPRIDEELQDQPVLQAELLMVVADAFERLGNYEDALPLVDRAIEQRRTLLGPSDPAVAESLRRAGYLLIREGRLDEAEPRLNEALDIQTASFGLRHPDVAQSQDNLAELRRLQTRLDEADSLATQALETRRSLLGPDHRDIAWSLNNLGVIRRTMGAYDDAQDLLSESLAMKRRLFGPTHSEVLVGVNNLANLARLRGDMAQAEDLYRETLDTHLTLFGDAHPATTTTLNNLAVVLYQSGQLAEAEVTFRRVVDSWAARGQAEHPDAIGSLNNLGAVLRSVGKLDEAVATGREATRAWKNYYGPSHERVGFALTNLALALHSSGRTDEAQTTLDEAVPIATSVPLQNPLRTQLAAAVTMFGAQAGQCADAIPVVAEILTGDASATDAELTQAVLQAAGCAGPTQ